MDENWNPQSPDGSQSQLRKKPVDMPDLRSDRRHEAWREILCPCLYLILPENGSVFFQRYKELAEKAEVPGLLPRLKPWRQPGSACWDLQHGEDA